MMKKNKLKSPKEVVDFIKSKSFVKECEVLEYYNHPAMVFNLKLNTKTLWRCILSRKYRDKLYKITNKELKKVMPKEVNWHLNFIL